MKIFPANCKYIVLLAVFASSFILLSAEKKKENENANYFLAAVIDNKNISAPSEREKQLVAMLDDLANTSSSLAIESSELARDVEQLISESGINPARAAALRLKAQSVTRLAGKVALITENNAPDSRKTLAKCRIIAVNKELGIVAIEAGARHGVFKGMVFHTMPGEPQAELRICVTRSDVSGAVVTRGNIDQLGVGMGISAVENRGRQ